MINYAKLSDLLRAARAEERERCARLIDLIGADWSAAEDRVKVYAAQYLAQEIRELK